MESVWYISKVLLFCTEWQWNETESDWDIVNMFFKDFFFKQIGNDLITHVR